MTSKPIGKPSLWEKFAAAWKRHPSSLKIQDHPTRLLPLRPWTGDPLDIRLPVELWLAIIDYLEGADLKSLSQTARRLREISIRQLFHTVSVAARSTDMATRVHPLRDAIHILQMVRIVRITGYGPTITDQASSDFFAALKSLICQMSGLEHLKVSYAYIEPSFYEDTFYLESLKTLELSSCTLASRETGPKNPPPPARERRLTSISFGWGVGTPGNSILASSYSTLRSINLQGLFTFHPTDALIASGPFPNLQSFETTEYLKFVGLRQFFSMNATLTTLTLWWRGYPGYVDVSLLVFVEGAEHPLLPNLVDLTCSGELAEALVPRRSIRRLNVWRVQPSVVQRIGETTASTYEKLSLSMNSLGWDAFTVGVLGKASAPLVQGVVEFTLSVTDVMASQLISSLATQVNHGALSSLQVLSVTANGPFTPLAAPSKDGDTFDMEETWVQSFAMQVDSLVQLENAKSLRYLALQVQGPGAFHVTCRSKRLGPAEWLLEAERAGETMEMRWTRRAKDLSAAVSVSV